MSGTTPVDLPRCRRNEYDFPPTQRVRFGRMLLIGLARPVTSPESA